MTARILSANEAACVTGVPLKQVHRIIDTGLPGSTANTREGSRVILRGGLVGLKLAHETTDILTLDGRRRLVRYLFDNPEAKVARERNVSVDVRLMKGEVRRGPSSLARAQRLIATDRGYSPVPRASREPAYPLTISPTCSPTATTCARSGRHTLCSSRRRLKPRSSTFGLIRAAAVPAADHFGAAGSRSSRARSPSMICLRAGEIPDRRVSEPRARGDRPKPRVPAIDARDLARVEVQKGLGLSPTCGPRWVCTRDERHCGFHVADGAGTSPSWPDLHERGAWPHESRSANEVLTTHNSHPDSDTMGHRLPGSAGFQPAASSRKRRYEHRPRARMPAIPGRARPWQAHRTGMRIVRNQERSCSIMR